MKKHRTFLGRRWPFTIEALLQAVDMGRQWLEDVANAPEKAQQKVRDLVAEASDIRRDRLARDCDAAAASGQLLSEAKLIQGSIGFPAVLAEFGISGHTAENWIAIAVFAKNQSELYSRFRYLGPARLAGLARLHQGAFQGLTLDTIVDLPRGEVKVRHLTDRELIAFLEKYRPVRKETPVLRAISHVLAAYRCITRAAKEGSLTEAHADFARSMIDGLSHQLEACLPAGASSSRNGRPIRGTVERAASAPGSRPDADASHRPRPG